MGIIFKELRRKFRRQIGGVWPCPGQPEDGEICLHCDAEKTSAPVFAGRVDRTFATFRASGAKRPGRKLHGVCEMPSL